MVDPSLDGGIEFGEGYFAGTVSPPAVVQPPAEMVHLACSKALRTNNLNI
jgi:hypothetical protein